MAGNSGTMTGHGLCIRTLAFVLLVPAQRLKAKHKGQVKGLEDEPFLVFLDWFSLQVLMVAPAASCTISAIRSGEELIEERDLHVKFRHVDEQQQEEILIDDERKSFQMHSVLHGLRPVPPLVNVVRSARIRFENEFSMKAFKTFLQCNSRGSYDAES